MRRIEFATRIDLQILFCGIHMLSLFFQNFNSKNISPEASRNKSSIMIKTIKQLVLYELLSRPRLLLLILFFASLPIIYEPLPQSFGKWSRVFSSWMIHMVLTYEVSWMVMHFSKSSCTANFTLMVHAC